MKHLRKFKDLASGIDQVAETPIVAIVDGISGKTLFGGITIGEKVKIISDDNGFLSVEKKNDYVQIQVLCGSAYYNVGLSGTSYSDGDSSVLVLSAATEGGKVNDSAFNWKIKAYTGLCNYDTSLISYTIQSVNTGMFLTWNQNDKFCHMQTFEEDTPTATAEHCPYWYIDTAGSDESENNWGASYVHITDGIRPDDTYQMRYDGTSVFVGSWGGNGRVKNTTFIS